MRLLIADDHDLVRDAIANLLEMNGQNSVEAVGDFDKAKSKLEQDGAFDLVFLDYDMPGMNGLDGLSALKRAHPDLPIAIISGTANASIAREALDTGAVGFIPKTLSAKSIEGAITLMASGAVFAPFEFLQKAADQEVSGLTERESGVLKLVCEGLTNKEIARELGLQEVTIKLHVRTLSRKLNARNRTHAAMIARQQNWF